MVRLPFYKDILAARKVENGLENWRHEDQPITSLLPTTVQMTNGIELKV